MKTLLVLITLLIAVSANASAQNRRVNEHDKAIANYIIDIKHENLGVVESGMLQLLAYVNKYPSVKTEQVYIELAKLMLDPDEQVRTKAFLTLSALVDQRILKTIKSFKEEDHELVYQQIAAAIEFKTLVKL